MTDDEFIRDLCSRASRSEDLEAENARLRTEAEHAHADCHERERALRERIDAAVQRARKEAWGYGQSASINRWQFDHPLAHAVAGSQDEAAEFMRDLADKLEGKSDD